MKLTLAFSPCPNDTFIFDALVNNKIKHNFDFDIVIADVEELNHLALRGELDITKISYHAYTYVQETYNICEHGSALGRGNGPLLVSKHKIYPDEVPFIKIAIPGKYTTAAFLLKYAFPAIKEPLIYLFSDIEDVVLSNETDAGVLIHEGRFTYHKKGLKLIKDLGTHWEMHTKQPIPLGCIAMKKELPNDVQKVFSAALKDSILFAINNPESPREYIKQFAQEQDEETINQHLNLFVNKYTLQLGDEGHKAIDFFISEAKKI